MELMAGVWEFVTFLTTTRRGLFWLVVALVMLSVIGAIYLISRKIYLPVPHIEFFHLIPGHARLPQGIKLGLTLPACTLPLVLVVGVTSALTQRPLFWGVSLLAGAVGLVFFILGVAAP